MKKVSSWVTLTVCILAAVSVHATGNDAGSYFLEVQKREQVESKALAVLIREAGKIQLIKEDGQISNLQLPELLAANMTKGYFAATHKRYFELSDVSVGCSLEIDSKDVYQCRLNFVSGVFATNPRLNDRKIEGPLVDEKSFHINVPVDAKRKQLVLKSYKLTLEQNNEESLHP